MSSIHVGSDGAVVGLWGRAGVPTIGVCELMVSRRELLSLTEGLSFCGAVSANDTADVVLPGDGWQQRGGKMLGDAPFHWVRHSVN